MKKEYNALVFCGRFQPFHNGHKAVIDAALEKAEEVIVVVGSSFQARSTKNPFTFEERKAMIDAVYTDEFNYDGPQGVAKTPRVKVVPVQDYPYDDNAWVTAVQSVVHGAIAPGWTDFPPKIGLIGHSKDSSSYYLNIFPDWKNHVEVSNVDDINATDIREMLFTNGGTPTDIMSAMPAKSYNWLTKFIIDNALIGGIWDSLATEYQEIKQYKQSWASSPYKPTFVTTDALIHQSGYILLIKRGGFPFKDYWALPGGYLASGQSIENNMIKELREETRLKIPEKVLRGSIKSTKVFDHPDRDPRGRTITHAFFVDLGYPTEGLPKVKGADDAKHAEWVKLSDLRGGRFAFDHYHIIKSFIQI